MPDPRQTRGISAARMFTILDEAVSLTPLIGRKPPIDRHADLKAVEAIVAARWRPKPKPLTARVLFDLVAKSDYPEHQTIAAGLSAETIHRAINRVTNDHTYQPTVTMHHPRCIVFEPGHHNECDCFWGGGQ